MKRKPFDELTFADDGMFQTVMKDPDISAELVERLLGVRVKQVKYPELEKAIEPYTKLKESYILFICKFDPFHDEKKKGYGLPRYTFQNMCVENNSVNLDDKTVKVVYNAKAYESVEDPKVRALLRFIQTDEPGEDDYSKRLSEFVAKAKENEKFRKEYADMNLHDFDIMTEAKEEGLAEGAQQKAVETARKLLADGKYTAEEISALLEIPVEAFAAPAN